MRNKIPCILLLASLLAIFPSEKLCGQEELPEAEQTKGTFKPSRLISEKAFLLLPVSVLKHEDEETALRLIEGTKAFNARFSLHQHRTFRGDEYGFATTAASMGITDDAELDCYRCCFKKISKSECGTYSSVYGNTNWAPSCPKSKLVKDEK